ncbi:hypothetical protein [Methylibium sp.]|uniref:hypothetical protein n=1 Tax=Methylibium sp. TaxID=2067992 RepID=UPI0025E49DF1|nr:hypothetical protein [Methylibium sp.]
MRKTTAVAHVGGMIKERLAPLPAASVSVTLRLPPELVSYVDQLVSSDQARDRTEAIKGCIRRHQQAEPGLVRVQCIELTQRELTAEVAGLVSTVSNLSDDVVLLGEKSMQHLDAMRSELRLLIAVGLYGREGEEEQGLAGGGHRSTVPAVALTSRPAPPASACDSAAEGRGAAGPLDLDIRRPRPY